MLLDKVFKNMQAVCIYVDKSFKRPVLGSDPMKIFDSEYCRYCHFIVVVLSSDLYFSFCVSLLAPLSSPSVQPM